MTRFVWSEWKRSRVHFCHLLRVDSRKFELSWVYWFIPLQVSLSHGDSSIFEGNTFRNCLTNQTNKKRFKTPGKMAKIGWKFLSSHNPDEYSFLESYAHLFCSFDGSIGKTHFRDGKKLFEIMQNYYFYDEISRKQNVQRITIINN